MAGLMLRATGSLTSRLFVVSSEWIAAIHQSLGLGTMPREPIAGISRCTSIWYARTGPGYGSLLDVEKSLLITCQVVTMLVGDGRGNRRC